MEYELGKKLDNIEDKIDAIIDFLGTISVNDRTSEDMNETMNEQKLNITNKNE